MPSYRGRHTRFRHIKSLLRALIVLAVVGLMSFGFIEPKLLQVRSDTLVSSELDGDAGRLRIVYVSDIHYGRWPYLSMDDVSSLVARINEQNADLVILGGDYAGSSTEAVSFFRRLPTIRATYGVYAVFGEYDRTQPESAFNDLKAVMRSRSITPLVNDVVKIRVGSKDIYLAGIDDLSASPDIAGVASKCRSEDFVILAAHDPEAIDTVLTVSGKDGSRNWVDLALCGHTLSGCAGAPKVSTSYTSGWYTPNRLSVLVSPGVGTVGFPFRFGAFPTLHVITVRSGT